MLFICWDVGKCYHLPSHILHSPICLPACIFDLLFNWVFQSVINFWNIIGKLLTYSWMNVFRPSSRDSSTKFISLGSHTISSLSRSDSGSSVKERFSPPDATLVLPVTRDYPRWPVRSLLDTLASFCESSYSRLHWMETRDAILLSRYKTGQQKVNHFVYLTKTLLSASWNVH